MAQIPSIKSLRIEEFPSERSWIDKLLSPMNLFINTVVNALSGQLTFGDNIQGQEQLLNFVYQSTADLPQYFKVTLPVRPQALYLVSAYENGLPVALLQSWQLTSNGQVQVSLLKVTSTGVSSLVVGATYLVKIRITP